MGAVDDPYTTCRLSTGGTQAWVARIRGAGLRDAGGSEVGAQLVITQGLDTPYCAESYYRRHTHQGVKRHCVAFGGDFGKPVIPTRWPVMAFTHPWGVNFEHFHMEHLPRLALYLQSKSALPGLKLAVVSDGYGSVGLSSWQRMAFEIAGVNVETDVFVPKRRRDGTTRMFETVHRGYMGSRCRLRRVVPVGALTVTVYKFTNQPIRKRRPSYTNLLQLTPQLLIPGFVGSDVPHPIGLDMLVQYHERAQAMSRNRTHARPRPSSTSGAGARSPSTSPSLTASDKPVYFTRRDAKSGAARKMTNEKELEKQLEALGWDVLTFGDYTLLERVEVRAPCHVLPTLVPDVCNEYRTCLPPSSPDTFPTEVGGHADRFRDSEYALLPRHSPARAHLHTEPLPSESCMTCEGPHASPQALLPASTSSQARPNPTPTLPSVRASTTTRLRGRLACQGRSTLVSSLMRRASPKPRRSSRRR